MTQAHRTSSMASLFQTQNSRSSDWGYKRQKLKTIPGSREQHGTLFRPNPDSLREIVFDGALTPRTVSWELDKCFSK